MAAESYRALTKLLRSAQFLEKRNVPYQAIEFRHPPHTAADVRDCCECGIEEVLKSVLLVADARAVLAVVPGDMRVSMGKLEKCTGLKRLKMATPQQVLAITAYRVGSVSPFGLGDEIEIVTDEKVFRSGHVYVGSGEGTILLKLATPDLKRALNGKIFDITSTI